MANTLLTPSVIAQAALATLYETTVAAQLVHRDYDSEFVARVGDTVTIRKPAVFEAKEFDEATGIAKRVVKVDTADHPSDGQVVAAARKVFKAIDRMTPQI